MLSGCDEKMLFSDFAPPGRTWLIQVPHVTEAIDMYYTLTLRKKLDPFPPPKKLCEQRLIFLYCIACFSHCLRILRQPRTDGRGWVTVRFTRALWRGVP